MEADPNKPAHMHTRIQVLLGGIWYEAAGFLKPGERSVSGWEALERCDNGGLVQTKEELKSLHQQRRDLTEELQAYRLATACRDELLRNFVAMFVKEDLVLWDLPLISLSRQWDQNVLVLRRVSRDG